MSPTDGGARIFRNRDTQETRFRISEETQLFTITKNDGKQYQAVARSMPGNDVEDTRRMIEFGDFGTPANLDTNGSGRKYVYCSMTTDPIGGTCPILCTYEGRFMNSRGPVDGTFPEWSLFQENTGQDYPPSAVYGVSPSNTNIFPN